MGAMVSQITSLTIVYSNVYSSADKKKKHQSLASLAFVRGSHRWSVNSPHKGPVTREMFPFDDIIIRSWVNDALSDKASGFSNVEGHVIHVEDFYWRVKADWEGCLQT